MQCRRCHRFMTVDAYVDMGNTESPLWLRAWRCGNCGKTDAPELFLNRVVPRTWVSRALKRLIDTRPRRGEVMALTV
jgi:hypothetical protein